MEVLLVVLWSLFVADVGVHGVQQYQIEKSQKPGYEITKQAPTIAPGDSSLVVMNTDDEFGWKH